MTLFKYLYNKYSLDEYKNAKEEKQRANDYDEVECSYWDGYVAALRDVSERVIMVNDGRKRV